MRSAKDYITFGLDLPTFKEAKEYILLVTDYVGMFKVGLELFVECGPDIIRFAQTSGPARIFLDLKLHDIPATVRRAVQRIVEYGVNFATVHCGESKNMLEAAVQGSGGKVGIIGVTVLTSVCGEDIRNSGFKTCVPVLKLKKSNRGLEKTLSPSRRGFVPDGKTRSVMIKSA